MKKKSRERGSAIILAILLLSFFMALSLNMFFIAQKKSERAGVKAKGVKVLSTIDGGAAIAYYELKKASDYVTKGIELSPRVVEETTATGTAVITGPLTDANGRNYSRVTRPNTNGAEIWGVQGVLLDNYNQFVSCRLSSTATQAALYIPSGNNSRTSTEAAIYASTAIAATYSSNGATTEDWRRKSDVERIWRLAPQADDRDMSIGGYKIVPGSLKMNGTSMNQITTTGGSNKTIEINVIYEKYLKIFGGTNIGDLFYQITCEERYRYQTNGTGEIIGDTIEDDIIDMTIEGK